MSDTEFDVVIAAYLIPDLAQKDFDALLKLVEDKQLEVEGVVLVTVDADGTVAVKETGDHLGRKGLEIGGGVGLVVGLFAPPLLAATVVGGAVGGVIGKFAKHRVESGLEEKMGAALPPGSAGHRRDLRSRQDRHGRHNARQRREEICCAGRRRRSQRTQRRPSRRHKPAWAAEFARGWRRQLGGPGRPRSCTAETMSSTEAIAIRP